jgi:hypothetical protein
MLLYGLKNWYNFIAVLRTNPKNLKRTQLIGVLLFLISLGFTFFGMNHLWSEQMTEMIDNNRGGYGPYG